MLNRDSVAFMLDVDNTPLDNDRFAADLTARLDRDFGQPERDRYRSIYTNLRARVTTPANPAVLCSIRCPIWPSPTAEICVILRCQIFMPPRPGLLCTRFAT